MLRWLILMVVLAFVVGQVVRMMPSRRDKQLQALRAAAAQAGLRVRFWTKRQAGYPLRQLPASGFLYLLPWTLQKTVPTRWALWVGETGEVIRVAGEPPSVATEWLQAFRQQYANAWALLESNEDGVGVLWEERGQVSDIPDLGKALALLSKSL